MWRAILLLLIWGLPGTRALAESEISFNQDIRPILSESCFECHGPDDNTREAGLRLDQRPSEEAILRTDASELLRRVSLPSDHDDVMPPADSGKERLSKNQIEALNRWIRTGATYETHWAFQPIRRPALPKPRGALQEAAPIDAFINAKLREAEIPAAPIADKRTLIRRATLDVTGLPPTREDIERFLNDTSPDAYERLIDRLLASDAYGERMTWMWLEAARYADTDGYQNDGPRDMWRWRDWVIDAYNSGMPFDQFTIEQLAGDLLPNPTLDQRIATGFNRNHRYNSEAGIPLDEFLLENAVDRVDTTATVWMGLTMGCARCHDHKFDPISQVDYYQLIDFFNDTPESGRAIKFGNSEPWVRAPTPPQQRRGEELLRDIDNAEAALRDAIPEIDRRIAELEDVDESLPALGNGLTERWPDAYEADGESGIELKKVSGLICNGRFSIGFHMRPATVDRGAVLSSETADTTRKGILVEFHEGHLRFHIISRWIAGAATLETKETFKPDRPVHVLLTNDGTQRAQGMRIYIDGERAATRTLHNTNSNKSGRDFGGKLRIGASHHIDSWKGTLSDLRIYSERDLSAHEARLLKVTTPLEDIAEESLDERSPAETEKLRAWFLEHRAPERLATLNQQVANARNAYTEYLDALPTTMVMEDASPRRPSHVRVRGVYNQLGQVVHANTPANLPPMPKGAPRNRLGFAQWLMSPDHPLTARVAANRYWRILFGTGLVDTPEDFGSQGSLPTHPQLLDWLASDLIESGWNTRAFLKNILMSATYRRDATPSDEARERDPKNRLLSHAPRYRLPAPMLRDQALFASGLLVDQIGGPSVKPYQPRNLWREASNFSYTQGKGADLYRRSLYTYWKRTLAPPSMAVFDAALRESCSVRRRETNTPLQALTTLNETGFYEAARNAGARWLRQADGSVTRLVEIGFESLTARKPEARELEFLTDVHANYLAEFQSSPEAALETLNVGESQSAPSEDPEELAAATLLANTLFNLDEVSSRE